MIIYMGTNSHKKKPNPVLMLGYGLISAPKFGLEEVTCHSWAQYINQA